MQLMDIASLHPSYALVYVSILGISLPRENKAHLARVRHLPCCITDAAAEPHPSKGFVASTRPWAGQPTGPIRLRSWAIKPLSRVRYLLPLALLQANWLRSPRNLAESTAKAWRPASNS